MLRMHGYWSVSVGVGMRRVACVRLGSAVKMKGPATLSGRYKIFSFIPLLGFCLLLVGSILVNVELLDLPRGTKGFGTLPPDLESHT